MRRILIAALIVICPHVARPCSAQESPLLSMMGEELSRSMQKLVLQGFDPPYFISYSLSELRSLSIDASYGALLEDRNGHSRFLSVDVHVGDYGYDNTPSGPEFFQIPDYYDRFARELAEAPISDDSDALRQRLWLLTDVRYKQALDQLNSKKGDRINRVEEKDRPNDFSREEQSTAILPLKSIDADTAAWKQTLVRISARFKQHPEILTSGVSFSASLRNQFLISSEGSRLQLSDLYYSLSVTADARCDDGMSVSNLKTWKASSAEQLPSEAVLSMAVDTLIDELLELRKAPAAEPYSGPAIIVNEAAGVFFHEALGHRLEGHRLRNEQEGHTFKGKLGQEVIPTFLSVVDDPNLTSFDGVPLYGHYTYDQEMVRAQRVELVENGVLIGFLMCRLPVKDFPRSNGHGRADIFSSPVSRMGNLIVSTNRPRTVDILLDNLLSECRSQGKEYGLIFETLNSGETNTSGFGVQSLRCQPVIVRRIYVANRKTELIRGVELIGTPLNILETIIAAGDDPAVFNGTCGAESGSVPVSAVSPSVLISKIEIQKSTQKSRRPPILPPPLFD